LLKELAIYLGLGTADPAQALSHRYGPVPNESFVRDARAVIENTWLARDNAALSAVVKALWQPNQHGYQLPSGRQEQRDWLADRNTTEHFCKVVAEQLAQPARSDSR
jgi:hypothetical protein